MIWSSPNSIYNCHNPKGFKFITKFRLGLIHLREYKFKHSFQDAINPLYRCSLNMESNEHFLLQYPQFVDERYILLENQLQIAGKYQLRFNTNATFWKYLTIFSILLIKRFDEPLFFALATESIFIFPCFD